MQWNSYDSPEGYDLAELLSGLSLHLETLSSPTLPGPAGSPVPDAVPLPEPRPPVALPGGQAQSPDVPAPAVTGLPVPAGPTLPSHSLPEPQQSNVPDSIPAPTGHPEPGLPSSQAPAPGSLPLPSGAAPVPDPVPLPSHSIPRPQESTLPGPVTPGVDSLPLPSGAAPVPDSVPLPSPAALATPHGPSLPSPVTSQVDPVPLPVFAVPGRAAIPLPTLPVPSTGSEPIPQPAPPPSPAVTDLPRALPSGPSHLAPSQLPTPSPSHHSLPALSVAPGPEAVAASLSGQSQGSESVDLLRRIAAAVTGQGLPGRPGYSGPVPEVKRFVWDRSLLPPAGEGFPAASPSVRVSSRGGVRGAGGWGYGSGFDGNFQEPDRHNWTMR